MDPILLLPGESKTIYFQINLKGTLYYKILNQSGTDAIRCWWIKGPFGSKEEIGILRHSGTIEIKGLIWGKLKASDGDSLTKVLITERSEIAATFPDIHF